MPRCVPASVQTRYRLRGGVKLPTGGRRKRAPAREPHRCRSRCGRPDPQLPLRQTGPTVTVRMGEGEPALRVARRRVRCPVRDATTGATMAAADQAGSGSGLAVRVSDLGVTFPAGTEALRGLTVDVEPGSFTAIIGPN